MIRKILALVLAVLMVIGLFAGCGQAKKTQETESAKQTEQTQSTEESGKKLRFGVVLHSLNGSFFMKLKEGAEAAGKALGVEVLVTGPATQQNLSEQVNMLENYINSGVDGVATVLWDQEGFNNVIKQAHDKGIPFVGFNADAPNSGRDAMVGQDSEAAGYAVGKYMFEKVMGGKGKYIIATCAPTETPLVLRMNGIKRAQQEYPNIELITTIDIGTDLTKAVGIIENAYMAHPDVNAFIGTDVFSEAIGTFINSNNLKGKVYGGGFDLTPGTLKHIKNGDMQMSCGQNPFLQGFYAVVQLYQVKALGYPAIDVNTGMAIVDASNVDATEPE
ncbi:MAG TPA: substrate-binding domain-containing protein [Clostridiaceae bacterium]|nr:substrate-binding domain-containing protein [Clostridiaceae bacterium]